MKQQPASLLATKSWLTYGAFCSCAGWLLSGVHELRPAGYVVLLLIAVAVAKALRLSIPLRAIPTRRFRRPLPAIYLALLLAALIGGSIYLPNNYDMLTYRLPRMQHWLAEGRWHWIHTFIQRMNYSGTGWEWMSLPLLLLGHSTRWLFLLNIASFLLLPGLTFAFLRSFGVGGRVAWQWMWLLPTSLTFAMQAGSGGNDALGAPLLMASVVFARRARTSQHASDLLWSLLAAALLTGAKASNLFLLLPCAIALLPGLPLLWRHRWATIAALPVLVFSSLAPLLVRNHHFTGDFAGSPLDEGKLKLHSPMAGLVGNAIQIAWWNLQPPILPGAARLDEVAESHLPASVHGLLAREFPRFSMHMGELPQEEGSGLGLAITGLAVLSLGCGLASARGRARATALLRGNGWNTAVLIGGCVALLIYMATLGSESAARLATPYYPFLLAGALLGVNDGLVRTRVWRTIALVAALSVWPAMLLNPSRPLFPAVRLTSRLAAKHPQSGAVRRMAAVYAVYHDRPDNLAALRQFIPSNADTVALLCSDDDAEDSLWRSPNPHRRVLQLCPRDDCANLTADSIHWLVTNPIGLAQQGTTLAAVLKSSSGTVVAQCAIVSKVSQGPVVWSVIRLR